MVRGLNIISIGRIYTLMISIFIIFVFIVLYFAFDKGVDLTDEGLYLALSQPLQVNNFAQLNQKVIFEIIHEITGISFGLKGLRLLKFLLLVASYIAILPILNYFKVGMFWKLLSFFGLFSQYAYFSQSLSYNSLAFSFYCIILSLFFLYNFYNLNPLWIFLAGFFASLAFLAKSTTGLLLLVLGIFFCVFFTFQLEHKRKGFLLILSFLSGFFLLQGLFSFISVEYEFFQTIVNGFELSSYNSTHNTIALIKYPLSSLRWILVLISVGYTLNLFVNNKEFKIKLVSGILGLGFFFWFFFSHDRLDLYRVYEFSFLTFTYILIGFSLPNLKGLSKQEILFLILILVSPLIVSFGTNSYYFKGGVLYMFFPFILLSILNRSENNVPNYLKLSSLMIVVLIISKILLNVIFIPFKQPTLLDELKPYTYLSGKEIMLPKSYHTYLTELNQVFEEYTFKEDKILGLYEMPGDILLAGRYHAINPCFWEPYQLDFYIKKAESEDMMEEVKFVLSQEKLSPSIFLVEDIEILDSLVHPKFGMVYFSELKKLNFN